MCDFAPRDNFPSLLAEAKLHAIIMGTGLIGSPIPDAAMSETAARNADSAPGSVGSLPDSGVRSFNLDACFKMGESR